MTKFNPPTNKPLDRAYFKYKDNPKDETVPKYMPCCGEEVDNDYLDVNNPEACKRKLFKSRPSK